MKLFTFFGSSAIADANPESARSSCPLFHADRPSMETPHGFFGRRLLYASNMSVAMAYCRARNAASALAYDTLGGTVGAVVVSGVGTAAGAGAALATGCC